MPRNNFDLLRLALALTVFLFHVPVITLAPQLSVLEWFPGNAAVQGFFVVSGFLVWMSFERSVSIADYASKRARRVIPAYVAVVLGATLAAVLLSESPISNLWSTGALKYFAAQFSTLTFLQTGFDGAFEGTHWMSVNGSLWSIKVEIGCYLLVPFIAWATHRAGWWFIALPAYLASVAWTMGVRETLAHQTPGMLSYFLAGATLYQYRDWLSARWRVMGPVGIGAWALCGVLPSIEPIVAPAAMAVTLTYVAVGLPCLGNAARFGDLSYGVYLAHWPILQCLVQMHLFDRPWLGFAIATVSVVAVSSAMWHWVEKPWLRRASHYVMSASGR